VAVLYHDFPYFFCMAEISSFVFEIFAYDVAGNTSREIAIIKRKYFIIVLVGCSVRRGAPPEIILTYIEVSIWSMTARSSKAWRCGSFSTFLLTTNMKQPYTPVDYQQERLSRGE
jgi:hypothetical protein